MKHNYKMPTIYFTSNKVKIKAYQVGEHLCVTDNGIIYALNTKKPLIPFLRFDNWKTASLVAAQIDITFGEYLELPDTYGHRLQLAMRTVVRTRD